MRDTPKAELSDHARATVREFQDALRLFREAALNVHVVGLRVQMHISHEWGSPYLFASVTLPVEDQ